MTYSIVARDPVTGQLGVGVQSGWLAAGALVPFAVAGVGAVATQSFVEPAYGPWCLDSLASGVSASEALAAALALDDAIAVRQVGVVSADGRVAAHTGERCIQHCGDLQGDGFTVQGNMLASAEVWPAMADAFGAAKGPLAWRLLAALEAAEAAGGDARGPMAGGLFVVSGEKAPRPGGGILLDIRVDHSRDPVGELRRLLTVADAYTAADAADAALLAGNPSRALDAIQAALPALPDDGNLRSQRFAALVALGDLDGARLEAQRLIDERPTWETVLRQFVAKGFVTLPPGVDFEDLL